MFILVDFGLSVLFPISNFYYFKGNLTKEINPSILNGILTGTAIIFGFVVFELREINSSIIEKLALSFPLLLYLMITLESVFTSAITGVTTSGIALIATSNFLFNVFYVAPVMIVKQSRLEIEENKNS